MLSVPCFTSKICECHADRESSYGISEKGQRKWLFLLIFLF